MWILVFFDLPTDTKKERKAAAKFRKNLLEDGFIMFQFSIYTRNCPSVENAQTHISRVKGFLPEYGQVGILSITDKQFGSMELFSQSKQKEPFPAVCGFYGRKSPPRGSAAGGRRQEGFTQRHWAQSILCGPEVPCSGFCSLETHFFQCESRSPG